VLQQAELGNIELWISVWVKVEVIRPKRQANDPLPEWAVKSIKAVPEAQQPLEELWRRFQRSSASPRLTHQQISKIEEMFEWPFLKKIYLDERIANKAVELCRDFGLRPGDAIHAASAILTGCEVLQRWDKDFDKVRNLIAIEEPQRINAQTIMTFDGSTNLAKIEQQSEDSITLAPTELEKSVSGDPEKEASAGIPRKENREEQPKPKPDK
jgi:predicted nucleic acid-binding protein